MKHSFGKNLVAVILTAAAVLVFSGSALANSITSTKAPASVVAISSLKTTASTANIFSKSSVSSVSKVFNSAVALHGACGGGQTFNEAVAGWKAKGVLDDVMRWAGVDPNGRDGDPIAELRKVLVKVRVIRGDGSVANNDCQRGMFTPLTDAADQPANSFVWTTRERIAKDGHVKEWLAADCGNLRGGNIWVAVSHPSKSKSKPGQSGCTQTVTVTGNNNNVTVNCGNNNKTSQSIKCTAGQQKVRDKNNQYVCVKKPKSKKKPKPKASAPPPASSPGFEMHLRKFVYDPANSLTSVFADQAMPVTIYTSTGAIVHNFLRMDLNFYTVVQSGSSDPLRFASGTTGKPCESLAFNAGLGLHPIGNVDPSTGCLPSFTFGSGDVYMTFTNQENGSCTGSNCGGGCTSNCGGGNNGKGNNIPCPANTHDDGTGTHTCVADAGTPGGDPQNPPDTTGGSAPGGGSSSDCNDPSNLDACQQPSG